MFRTGHGAPPQGFGRFRPQSEASPAEKGRKAFWRWAASLLAVSVLTVVVLFALDWSGRERLHRQLMRGWSKTVYSEGALYTHKLDFTRGQVTYSLDSPPSGTVCRALDYMVVSSHSIRLVESDREIEISFNSEYTMMTCTPALVLPGAADYWFQLETTQ